MNQCHYGHNTQKVEQSFLLEKVACPLFTFYSYRSESTGLAKAALAARYIVGSTATMRDSIPIRMKPALKSQRKDCFNIRLRMNTDKSIMQAHNLAG